MEKGAFAQQERLLFGDNGDFPGRRNGIYKGMDVRVAQDFSGSPS